MRIGIVGLGWVGASVAISTLHRGIARELWLNDIREGLAEAESWDLAHGASFYPPCEIRPASVEAMAEACDAIVIAAGKGALPGKSRLDSLSITSEIAFDLGKRLRKARGVVVVVTNPVDVITQLIQEESGLPPQRVIGTGTTLDTARLRFLLSNRLRIDERSIHAYVLGEHGDSSFVAWSGAVVGGLPLRHLPNWKQEEEEAIEQSVRRAAYEIIARKGATNHAIGLVTASLLQAIVRDERRIATVSILRSGPEYSELIGPEPICLSLPTVIGAEGAGPSILPRLDERESALLRRSADILRQAHRSVISQRA
ncbi:MAG: hypothetical protein NZM37_06925 [Sandaracinaceae bacterium]|nr:hypothetical protein [Sandaracinaceae bacterium]MDW8247283.1 hypothetical protein [Sandaracinaceae bacterium]